MVSRKEFANDGKGAVAGEVNSLPERDNIDTLGSQAGIKLCEGEEIALKETLAKRDEERWELDADSAQSDL